MVFILALGAAFANALTSVFQRKGIELAPADTTLRFSLIRYALRRKIWLAGFGLMIISFLLQAVALHLGRLSEVQPILVTELVFLVVVLAAWFGFSIGRREWIGALCLTGGLAGFLYFADPVEGTLTPPPWAWGVTGGACIAAMTISVLLALRGPRWWRAAMFGTAAAISFAFTAACTKLVSGYAASDWAMLYRHWETYALAVFGALAVFLTQNAIHAGPIVASQSTVVLVDPLASILVGVSLFGDDLRTSGAWGPLEALSLLVMFVGAVTLAHSPLVAGLKGGNDQYTELLSPQHPRAGGMADAGCPTPPPAS
ncbi:MAG TPA: DMT family transporter [Streptosporangiaceae bacterium]|jgi:drug/metabolite transporter (DMT)-like permease|nr:DMT family transporter [Streptosporangiaceae bacterium]